MTLSKLYRCKAEIMPKVSIPENFYCKKQIFMWSVLFYSRQKILRSKSGCPPPPEVSRLLFRLIDLQKQAIKAKYIFQWNIQIDPCPILGNFGLRASPSKPNCQFFTFKYQNHKIFGFFKLMITCKAFLQVDVYLEIFKLKQLQFRDFADNFLGNFPQRGPRHSGVL